MRTSKLQLSVTTAVFFSALLMPTITIADDCRAHVIDEYLGVKYVHDGDTLHLSDGQKVRLVGLNTPELARDNISAEPYAIEARDALRRLLKSESHVGVQYGQERHDRHGRTLAHLYLVDGRSLQQWLLENGYAVAIVVPPNLRNLDCYHQAERIARSQRRGLWGQHGDFMIDVGVLAGGDTSFTAGFKLLSGQVSGIKQTKKGVWIALGPKFSLWIAAADERYFDQALLLSLQQQKVVVRGWLTQRKGRWSMRVRHSQSLEVILD